MVLSYLCPLKLSGLKRSAKLHILYYCIVTFNVELGKFQLLLVVPEQEVEVLPGDLFLVVEARGL